MVCILYGPEDVLHTSCMACGLYGMRTVWHAVSMACDLYSMQAERRGCCMASMACRVYGIQAVWHVGCMAWRLYGMQAVWHAGCMTCRLYDLQTICSVDCVACRLYDKIVVNFWHFGTHRKSLFGHYISHRPIIVLKNLLPRPFYKINRSASRLAKKRSIHATGTEGSTQSSSLSILKSSNK